MKLAILTLTIIMSYYTLSYEVDTHTTEKSQEMVEIVKANWKLGLDVYMQIHNENKNKNLFFSPYGLTAALLMLHQGAKGTTATNLADELGLPNLNEKHYMAQSRMHKSVKLNEGRYDLFLAKKFYFDKTIDLLPEYTEKIQKYFEMTPEKLDFKNTAGTTAAINKYVAQTTNNKITDMVPTGLLKPDNKFLIASAVDFKGYWLNKFDTTTTAPFTKIDGTSLEQKYMLKTAVFKMVHDETFGVKMLELPYRTNHHAVYLVLPDTPTGLTTFESTYLNTETLKTLLAKLTPTKLNLQIPSFKLKSHYELTSEFKAIGLTDVFDPDTADFTGIDATAKTDKLALNLYLQEARFDFDDDGDNTPLPDTPLNKEPFDFIANHPFLFAVICKHTNAPFFLGKYTGIDK